MLNFKNDQDIERLVESLNLESPRKMNEPKFSDFLIEMVEEVLTEKKVSGPTQGNKFEWAVIAAAIDAASGAGTAASKGGLIAKGAQWWGEGSSAKDERSRKKYAAEGKPFPKDRLMKAKADLAINLLLKGGIPKEALATANTYEGSKPKGGGDPKTDITFGDGEYKVSLKMAGQIQLASSEAKSTSESIKLAMEQFIEEKKDSLKLIVEEARDLAAKEAAAEARKALDAQLLKLKEDVAEVSDDMMKQGYGATDAGSPRRYVSGTSSDEEFKANYESWIAVKDKTGEAPKKLKKFEDDYEKYFGEPFDPHAPDAFNTLTARMQAAKSGSTTARGSLTGKESVAKIEHMFERTKAGVLQVAENYDWDAWTQNHKASLVGKIGELLNNNPEFKFLIVDEELSGRRKFKDNPAAVADYILSSTSFHKVKAPDRDASEEEQEKYEKIINKYAAGVTIDARGKGRFFGKKSISYRFDINPDKIAVATAKQTEKNATESNSPMEEGKVMDWIKKGVESVSAAWEKLKGWASGFIDKFAGLFTKNLEKTLIEAVDVDELTEQIADDPAALFGLGGD